MQQLLVMSCQLRCVASGRCFLLLHVSLQRSSLCVQWQHAEAGFGIFHQVVIDFKMSVASVGTDLGPQSS